MAATIPATFLALLQADTGGGGVATLATGGIVGLYASGVAPITTTTAPSAFVTDATSEVTTFARPVVVVSTTTGGVVGPANMGVTEWLRVAVYALTYAETRTILDRVHTIAHEEIMTLTDGRQVDLTHVDTPWTNQIDDTIQPRGGEYVALEAARYLCTTYGGKAI